MTGENVNFLVTSSDEADADALRKMVSQHAPTEVQMLARKNLGGDASAWLVLGSILASQIPALLNFVKEMAHRNRVSSIEVGKVKIDNPSPEQVELLLRELQNK